MEKNVTYGQFKPRMTDIDNRQAQMQDCSLFSNAQGGSNMTGTVYV
jgi:hypothetical protein